jgi:hypothetical protein
VQSFLLTYPKMKHCQQLPHANAVTLFTWRVTNLGQKVEEPQIVETYPSEVQHKSQNLIKKLQTNMACT